MSIFKIEAKNNLMKFPTEVSPFIFKESKELAEKMLKEGNQETKNDRKFIKKFIRGITVGCDVCWGIVAGITLIGIPCYLCYISKKAKKSRQANSRIIKTWEEITKKYNEELIKLGVHARFNHYDIEINNVYFNKCCFEFNFNYPVYQQFPNNVEMINVNNQVNLPAPLNCDANTLKQEEAVKQV